ncbi:MAG: MerR family transcriptional regulator [Nostoc sp. TH1S01]|nr:MerR family transcriptional regulator [Nostoc sp. TH1S01]
MLIGELSKKTGLSKDTIRFYEKMGLIAANERQAGTRIYKEFSVETIENLRLINQGKALGFTLNEIKQLIHEWGSNEIPKTKQILIIEHKLQEITEKIQQLEEIKTYLAAKRTRLQQEV